MQITEWVEDINNNLGKLPTRGPHSKYDLTPGLDHKGAPAAARAAQTWGGAVAYRKEMIPRKACHGVCGALHQRRGLHYGIGGIQSHRGGLAGGLRVMQPLLHHRDPPVCEGKPRAFNISPTASDARSRRGSQVLSHHMLPNDHQSCVLPALQELKDAGFDLSIMGFGSMEVYHANDEYARLSDMAKGFEVLKTLLRLLGGAEKGDVEESAMKRLKA